MIYRFDRAFAMQGYTMQTDGRYALLTPPGSEGTLPAKPPSGAMVATVRKWLKADLHAIDVESLRAFLRPLDCDECKNRRTWPCKQCGGRGTGPRRCDACNLEHECVCDAEGCQKGIVRCECTHIRCALVLGEPFDLWRISDALEVLGCPPEAAGIVEGQLILRAGYTYAVVMRLYTSQSDFEEVNAGWP